MAGEIIPIEQTARQILAIKSLAEKWSTPQKTNMHGVFDECPFCKDAAFTDYYCLCPRELCDLCFSFPHTSLIKNLLNKYEERQNLLVKNITPAEFRAVRRILLKIVNSK